MATKNHLILAVVLVAGTLGRGDTAPGHRVGSKSPNNAIMSINTLRADDLSPEHMLLSHARAARNGVIRTREVALLDDLHGRQLQILSYVQ